MREYEIGKNEAGQRFDKYLHKLMPQAGNSFLYKMLRKKNIILNGKKAEGREILVLGDHVKLFLSEETFGKFQGVDEKHLRIHEFHGKEPEIIWESPDYLICAKPAGLLTQKATEEDESLNEWFIAYLLRSGQISEEELRTFHPSVCNRLDRNTSGIVLCGKTLSGSQKLTEIIRDGRVGKYYRTFVKGKLTNGSTIEGYLYKEERTNRVIVYSSRDEILQGREVSYIRTSYQPLAYGNGITYMEIALHTGKTHQIRAHLASIGHPIIGDSKYGDPGENRFWKQKYNISCQLLHAYRVEFGMEEKAPQISGKSFVAREPAIFDRMKNEMKQPMQRV